MKWKNNMRKQFVSSKVLSDSVAQSLTSPHAKSFEKINGKMVCVNDIVLDVVDDDGEGARAIMYTTNVRTGEYVFPAAYIHTKTGVPGATVDARFCSRGWAIRLDMGEFFAWILESHLEDAGMGSVFFRPGVTAQSASEILEKRAERSRASAA